MSHTDDKTCNCGCGLQKPDGSYSQEIEMTKDQAREILELDVKRSNFEMEFGYQEWNVLVNRAAHILVEDLMGIKK